MIGLSRAGMKPRSRAPQPSLQAQVKMLSEQVVAAAGRTEDGGTKSQLEALMAKLDALLDAVSAQQTQIDSLIVLTGNLHQRVLEAMGETITPSQAMRIEQVFKAVEENAVDISAAIKANTIEATAGAVTGGESLANIKGTTTPIPAVEVTPGPTPTETQPSTESTEPAT